MSETRTLLVETRDKSFKIDVAADWKVTFGKQPGSRDYDAESRELRIYEGTSQRACFVGVKSFRDLSIPLTYLVVDESGVESWEITETGSSRKRKTRRTVKEVPGPF